MLDWLRKPPVTEDEEDADDQYTLRDLASEVADLGRAVDGLLKREQRRDAAERQQRSRERRSADGGSVESSPAPAPDRGVRLADSPPLEEEQHPRGMSPGKRALWAQVRANRGGA